MFALSTAWNADKWQDGQRLAQEIYSLGFKKIELNFSLTEPMVEDIFKFCRKEEIEISSLHNYCPIPKGLSRQEALPDCFSLSSLNEDERKKALEYTKVTISTAHKLSAKAVVLHCGRVEIEDKTRRLIDLHRSGLKKSKDYQTIASAFIQERKTKSPDYFAQILKSLDELSKYAQKLNIVLGIENRFYYREIPSLDEFEIIFDKFKSLPIAYWHDVGHSYISEQLGFIEEESLLKKYSSRLYGFHLHNVKNLADHNAPVDGDFDFNKLAPYAKQHTINVIEAHSQAKPQAIKESVEYLKGIFND